MTLVGVLALLAACGGSSNTDSAGPADKGATVSATTSLTSPKVALPTDPCALLTDEEVKEIMGWPSTADVQGEGAQALAVEGAAPFCHWNHVDDLGDPDMLSLVLYTWSAMEQEFASPRTAVQETDNDRIRLMSYGDLHPAAVVRFGEDAVMVGIADESPDRADPVDVAVHLLKTYSA